MLTRSSLLAGWLWLSVDASTGLSGVPAASPARGPSLSAVAAATAALRFLGSRAGQVRSSTGRDHRHQSLSTCPWPWPHPHSLSVSSRAAWCLLAWPLGPRRERESCQGQRLVDSSLLAQACPQPRSMMGEKWPAEHTGSRHGLAHHWKQPPRDTGVSPLQLSLPPELHTSPRKWTPPRNTP